MRVDVIIERVSHAEYRKEPYGLSDKVVPDRPFGFHEELTAPLEDLSGSLSLVRGSYVLVL